MGVSDISRRPPQKRFFTKAGSQASLLGAQETVRTHGAVVRDRTRARQTADSVAPRVGDITLHHGQSFTSAKAL